VLGICDRVIVMRSGRLVESVERGRCDEKGILAMALPVADEAVCG
jgi:ABC-type sugar transport system ATPase subunit